MDHCLILIESLLASDVFDLRTDTGKSKHFACHDRGLSPILKQFWPILANFATFRKLLNFRPLRFFPSLRFPKNLRNIMLLLFL